MGKTSVNDRVYQTDKRKDKEIRIRSLWGAEGAGAPDLLRGLTGADPGVDREEGGSDGGSDDTGEAEKSDSRSVSLISLRTLLDR